MGFIQDIPPPFGHQERTTQFLISRPYAFDMSDPGTGKTRSGLDAISFRRRHGELPALVLAPKSILLPAWGMDCAKFTPHLSYSIATAQNRAKAFAQDVDLYITNHDAVKWILKQGPKFLARFGQLYVDESTAYKNRQSQRSQALKRIATHIPVRVLMSGTPNPLTVLDLWHQVLLLDGGQRLGNNFFRFRMAVCAPTQTGPRPEMVEWSDKPGAQEAIADMLRDITIRNKFEECVDVPPNHTFSVNFEMTTTHRRHYETLRKHSVIELSSGDITAINAGAITNKLLQAASGAVYDSDGKVHALASDRYELVLDLVQQRADPCVVAFVWTHQRDALVAEATARKLRFRVIDGEANDTERQDAVQLFQNGMLDVLFAHPMSAAHGLTLTRGRTTIWTSPIYDAERFQQFNRRIYRAGQTAKTETILVTAADTLEAGVYDRLSGKLSRMNDLLSLVQLHDGLRPAA